MAVFASLCQIVAASTTLWILAKARPNGLCGNCGGRVSDNSGESGQCQHLTLAADAPDHPARRLLGGVSQPLGSAPAGAAAKFVAVFRSGFIGRGSFTGMFRGLEPLGLRFDAVALANEDPLALFAYAVLAIGPIAATLIVGIWIWRLRVMHRMHQDAVERSGIEL